MKPGEIYNSDFDERPFRIIGLDEHEVFYDCMWQEGQWTFSGNFKANSIYYRMPVIAFKTRCQQTGFQELTEEELSFFRPDLPLRFGRTRQLNWNDFDPEQNLDSGKIDIQKIVLVPYGPNGGHKRGAVIDDDSGLSIQSIIFKAKELQEAVNPKVSNGIGFYRLGTQRGIPSYAIGEFLDRAGVMKE